MKLQEKADNAGTGLYIHVPFCARSCDFCQFYQEEPKRSDIERYLDGMEHSLRALQTEKPIQTVFIGGGTPGLLKRSDLERLGNAVLSALGGQPPIEWTVEMAPSSIKKDKLMALRDLGVSRLSIGVQSFQENLLEALGRIHTEKQVKSAIECLHAVGWENFNLDLIFAVPGQTPDDWQSDLQTAIAIKPQHLSTYCLTYEEDTALWLRLQKGSVSRMSEEDEAAFYEIAWEYLCSGGYQQYEISNYAQPGFACQHNLSTWEMGEWIGLGPSASSQWNGKRWTEPYSLDQWLKGIYSGQAHRQQCVELNDEILAADCLIFGLRMNSGVNIDHLLSRYPDGLPAGWDSFEQMLVEESLAIREGPLLKLTAKGRLVADRIGSEILAL